MAQWRKVVVSGSSAVLNEISASGDVVPISDAGSSLGSITREWNNLYIDGTANIDSLVADTADINGGTVDNATIGANTHTSIKGTTIDATTDFTIDGLVLTADTITNDAALEVVSTGLTLNASLDIALSADGGNVTMDDGTITVFDFNTDTPEFKIMDDAQVANYASIAVGDNGATTFTTVDTDAAAANLLFTVDGTAEIASQGLITLDSGAAINLEPAAGSAILLDGTISIDGGVVTGATSITSTNFVGIIDGALGSVTPAAVIGTTIDASTDFTVDGLVISADDITNDNGLEIQTAAGDITLDPGGNNVLPGSDSADSLGASGTAWAKLWVDDIDLAGQGSISMGGTAGRIDLDADDDTSIRSAADDVITFEAGAVDISQITSTMAISGSATSTGSFGHVYVQQDLTVGGDIILGDANTDSVTFGADISSDLLPDADDTYDLGSASQAWQDLFLEGDITFSDAGAVQTTAGNLQIDSLAATLVLDGHTGVDIDASNSGKVSIDGAGGIDIGVAADVAFDIDTAALDIDSSGAITIDGTGTVSIDGADDMNFTITSGTGGEDLTIQQIGANDSSIIITAAGTGTDAVSIDATAGDMLIAPSLINGKTLTIGPASATQMVFTPHGTAGSEKISLINTAGTADDAIKIDAVAGGLTLAAGNDSLHIDADGTDADALNIDSAGGIDIDAAAAVDILAASTLTAKGATAATFGDDTGTWEFDGSGAVSETGMTTFSLTPSSTMDIDAGGAVTIDGTSVTIGADDSGVAISIGHSTSETTVNDNLTITGDLTVNGDQTIVSTTNLAVADKFATFGSGSISAAQDGGIIIQNAATSGYGLGYDTGTSRWVLDNNLAVAATNIVPDAYVGTVELGTTHGDLQGVPTYGSGVGSIYVDTDDAEIWIYA
jgi:hypothetical protein